MADAAVRPSTSGHRGPSAAPAAGPAGEIVAAPGVVAPAASPTPTPTPTPSGRAVAAVPMLLAVADALGVGASLWIVAGLVGGPAPSGYRLVLVALGFPAATAAARYRHRLRLCLRLGDEIGRILAVAGLGALACCVLAPGSDVVSLGMAGAGGLVVARAVGYSTLRAARRRGRLVETALVVGAGEMGVLVAEALVGHPELGAVPVGFVDTLPPPEVALPFPVLGGTSELPALVGRLRARRVLVCFPVERDRDVAPLLRACRMLRVDVCLVPRLHDLGVAVPRAALDEVWGIPLLPLRRGYAAPGAAGLKRALDVLVAGTALAVGAPLLVVLAAVLRWRHGKPVLFRQVRTSGRGRTATVLKLRTLPAGKDHEATWSVPAEAAEGMCRWLRRSHLDELPQLLNVLRGELSLVGPRPERPSFVARFAEEIEGYADRDRMPAGITGWAQVHGLHGDTPLCERARFDNAAIETWTPFLELVVIARTLVAIARGALR